MELAYGAKVIDGKGEALGTVDHIMRNTWTGEISKFVVRRKAPAVDLFLSVDDVQEANGDIVRLKVALEDLSQP